MSPSAHVNTIHYIINESNVDTSSKNNHCSWLYFAYLCALCGSNRVANSGLTGSETANKDCAVAKQPEETRSSQTRDNQGQIDKGESQISQTQTAGRRSSKTAGTKASQMETGEGLYMTEGDEF